MTSRCAVVLALLSLMFVLPAVAQQGAPQPATPARDFVVDENYRLSAGDVIIVSVLGEKDLSGPLTVGSGGSIALPIVGSVQVVGKTLSATRDLIARTYRDVIREPYVSVALDETASKRRVSVGGAVEKPGSFVLPLGATAAEAVVAAGINEDSDLTAVTLTHATGERVRLDLSGLRTHEPLPNGLVLRSDDTLYVPWRDSRLTVLGQVAKPGSYTVPLGRTIHVIELLTQIGGGFTETADRRNALLIRSANCTSEDIDLQKMFQEGDLRQNYALEAGDVLVVPEANRVTVAGEVMAPASFYPGNRFTLLEAIVKAGGFTPLAGLKQAEVKRANGEICQVDLDALWRRGDVTQNLLLGPGDIVMVPRAEPEEVLIAGAVVKPGSVDMREERNRSLLKLLETVLPTPAADTSRVSIFRANGEHLVSNARAALEQGDMRQNIILQPGDVIFVPDSGKVAVLGAFLKSGLIDYDPKKSLMQYLAEAGLAPASQAYLDRGVLIRARPDGTTETVKLDLSRLWQGIVPEPVKVLPGDIIFFQPKSEKKSLWEQVQQLLWTAGSIRGLFGF